MRSAKGYLQLMADSGPTALAGFLGTPLGGLLVGLFWWYSEKKPCTYVVSGITMRGECVGANHDMAAFVGKVTGVCTVAGWLILGCVWLISVGRKQSN